MRKSGYFGAGLFVLGILASGGCSGDKCPSGDLDCFLEHLVLVEPKNDGAPMGLVSVPAGKISPTGGGSCAGTICNGLCVSPGVDPQNCGGCGIACPSGASCVQGACACPPGRTECNGACVDLSADPSACGTCGVPCGGGTYCVNGACVANCDAGRTLCGSACVDTQTNAAHCGGCDHACGAGQTCSAGACQCTQPAYPCGCIDPTTDPQNCGGCGNVCPSGQACSGGACGSMGSAGTPPSIDNTPAPLALGEPGELAPLDLDFTDPNGCAPAFCARLCNHVGCSVGFVCTRPKRDGVIHGTWRSYLGFLAEPADQTETFTTGVVPVSAPGCPEDLVDQMAADTLVTTVAVGAEVQIATTVAHQTSNGGGGDDEYCYTVTGFCNCTVSACTNDAGECWYDTSAGRYPCPGCNCASAAAAVVNVCCPH